jgi:type IV pilus assembly protein PilW
MYKKTTVGFTLFEIMLTLLLGTFILAATMHAYSSVTKTYHAEVSLASLQENARLSTFILQKNIRDSGYGGCVKSNIKDGIKGYDLNHLPFYLRDKNIVAGSDTIVIQKADSNITQLTANVAAKATVIKVKSNPATQSNSWLLVSDCTHADQVAAKNFTGNNINLVNPITHAYKTADTEVAQFTEIAYFISPTSDVDAKGNPIYALYKLINGSLNASAHKMELVDGIVNMKILYGVDVSGRGFPDVYYASSQIKAWSRVKSVRIVLYMLFAGKVKQLPVYIALRDN